jgi:hypothetical protein
MLLDSASIAFPPPTNTNVNLANPIEASALPGVTHWLDIAPDRHVHWRAVYVDQPNIWDELSSIFTRVLQRRYG